MRFYDGLNLKKTLRRFVLKKVLENKTLLSSNIFHANPLIFPEIQTACRRITLLFNAGTSNFVILADSISAILYSPYCVSCKGPIISKLDSTTNYLYKTIQVHFILK